MRVPVNNTEREAVRLLNYFRDYFQNMVKDGITLQVIDRKGEAKILIAMYDEEGYGKIIVELYESDLIFEDSYKTFDRIKDVIEWNLEEYKMLREEEEMIDSKNIHLHGFKSIFRYIPRIKKVIFSGPATIILWCDRTKTVAKCSDMEKYDKWSGMAICVCKKLYGDDFKKIFRKFDGDNDLRREDRRNKKRLKKLEKERIVSEVIEEMLRGE